MTDIPRRIRVDRMVPAEYAIYAAQQAVEAMPADVRLTEAGTLLSQARDKVADYVDEPKPAPAAPLCPHGERTETNRHENDDRIRTVSTCNRCGALLFGRFAKRLAKDGTEAWGPVDGMWWFHAEGSDDAFRDPGAT